MSQSHSSESETAQDWSTERVLQSIATAEDPDAILTLAVVERVEAANPTLADAVRCCAIPRHFNAEILGVVRGDPDAATNRRLLEFVLTLTFVLSAGQGLYKFDETTRRVLIANWQESGHAERFAEINARLTAYYEQEHDRARSLDADLGRVRGLVQRNNPTRYVQLAMMIEGALLAPLLEVIYHESLRSADAGFDAFKRYSYEYEVRGQLAMCESLLHATRHDVSAAHPTAAAKVLDWLTYFEARFANRLSRESSAEALIVDLLKRGVDDPRLEVWLRSELAYALERLTRFREAFQAYEDVLAVHVRHKDLDPGNLAGTHTSLARMQEIIGHLEAAADGYRQAAELARGQDDPGAEFGAVISLSAVLQIAGHWEEAINAAMAALHLARTKLRPELSRHQRVAEELATLMVDHKPALAETAFQTGDAFIAATSSGAERIRHFLAYVDMLRDSGQIRRGLERLHQLKTELGGADVPWLSRWLMLTEAQFAEIAGDIAKAAELNSAVIEEATRQSNTPWQRAVALYRSAGLELACALWNDAERHATEARQAWTLMGLDAYAAGMQVMLAEVCRHRGDLETAQRMIDEAEPVLLGATPAWRADLHETKGHILEDRGQWAAAVAQYEKAVDILRQLVNRKQAALVLERLSRLAGRQGKWAEAELQAKEAAILWHELADLDRYEPTKASIAADKANARGIRLFADASEKRRYRFTQARDAFRQASERQTRNPWYLLNLSYACASLNEWEEACHALELAISGGLEGLPESFFRERLHEYRELSLRSS